MSLYCEEYVYRGLHISDRLDTVYELPFLINNLIIRVKHFYTNRVRCEVLTGYLSLGRRPGGDWANKCHWTKHVNSFLVKQEVGAATDTSTYSSLSHSSWSPLFDVQYNNYTVNLLYSYSYNMN